SGSQHPRFDVLLDLLLAYPDLAVVLHADQLEINLVVHHRAPPRRVDDAVDAAGKHVVRAALLPHRVARVFTGMHILVGALVAHHVALGPAGDELCPPRVDERALDVLHEGFSIDEFVADIADAADNDGGTAAIARDAMIFDPRARQHVGDHLLGHKPGIRVVPLAADVGGAVRVYPRHLRAHAA